MNRSRRYALAVLAGSWVLVGSTTARSQASAPSDKPGPDLSGVRAMALEALGLVRRGDLTQARSRVEEMEVQWRLAQSAVKAVSPAKWKAVDAAIDRVERELRFWRVRQSDSAAALQALIDAIDARG